MPEITALELTRRTYNEFLQSEITFCKQLNNLIEATDLFDILTKDQKSNFKTIEGPQTDTEKAYNGIAKTLNGIKNEADREIFIEMLHKYVENMRAFLQVHAFYHNNILDTTTLDQVYDFATGESADRFAELMLQGSKFMDLSGKIPFDRELGDVAIVAVQRGPRYKLLAQDIISRSEKISDREREKFFFYNIGEEILHGIGAKALLVNKVLNEDNQLNSKASTKPNFLVSLWQRFKNFVANIFTRNQKDNVHFTGSSISVRSDVTSTTSTGERPQTSPRSSNLSVTSSITENNSEVASVDSPARSNAKLETPENSEPTKKPPFVLRPRNGPLSKEDFIKKPKTRPREPGDPIGDNKPKRFKEIDKEQTTPEQQAIKDLRKPTSPGAE